MAQTGTDTGFAAQTIRAGGLVAFATETVYGLGADATNADAVVKIFEAKKRPLFDPLIVHIASLNQLDQLVINQPPLLKVLANNFWPGPLTLLLPRNADVIPDLVTSGLEEVGIRIPNQPLALEFLNAAGCPVAAPSANLFGQISPTTAAHVDEQLGDSVDYILDGGPCDVGIESTILRIVDDQNLQVLRYGGIAIDDIRQLLPKVKVEQATAVIDQHEVQAPGQLQRHYAPRTPMVLRDHPVAVQGKRCGLLSYTPQQAQDQFTAVEILSDQTSDLKAQMVESAKRLFAAMRRLDAQSLDLIVAKPFPEIGLGRALNDRLQRASEAN